MKQRAAKHRAPATRRVRIHQRPSVVAAARQALCLLVLGACLSTASVLGTPSADAGESAPSPDSAQAQPRGNARIELPRLQTGGRGAGTGTGMQDGGYEIPATALDAYRRAEVAVGEAQPGCHLPWQLVAGIGRVESVHATGYGLRADGSTAKPIRGPRLDGRQFALIRDTEDGRWDGDTTYDRAVGPMQFIPSTWASWGADGNADSRRDPNNIYDAALGTGLYLCAGGRDLSREDDLDQAVLSYNNSREYVNDVLGWMRTYQDRRAKEVANPSATEGRTHTERTATPTRPSSPDTRNSDSAAPRPATAEPPGNEPRPSKPTGTPGQETARPRPPVPSVPAPVSQWEGLDKDPQHVPVGTVFDGPRVRAVRSDGSPAAGQTVTFQVSGDATFVPGNIKRVQRRTNDLGIAAAPQLQAGLRPGSFTVRAALGTLRPLQFRGEVRPQPAPVADALTRTDDTPLQAPPGSTFTQRVPVRATSHGNPVRGTDITATVLPKDRDEDHGPYFTDAHSNPVRSHRLPPTDEQGITTLPKLYADEHPGTYTLRLSTPDGTTLSIELIIFGPEGGNGANSSTNAPCVPRC